MGAWGVLAFDNDEANDWAYDLVEADDLSLVESAFDMVAAADDYLEAPDASNALAACEVLARLIRLWALFLLTYSQGWQAVECFPTVEARLLNPP